MQCKVLRVGKEVGNVCAREVGNTSGIMFNFELQMSERKGKFSDSVGVYFKNEKYYVMNMVEKKYSFCHHDPVWPFISMAEGLLQVPHHQLKLGWVTAGEGPFFIVASQLCNSLSREAHLAQSLH